MALSRNGFRPIALRGHRFYFRVIDRADSCFGNIELDQNGAVLIRCSPPFAAMPRARALGTAERLRSLAAACSVR